MTYYKVVKMMEKPLGMQLESALAFLHIAYVPNVLIRPPNGWGPLTVFVSFKNARDFVTNFAHKYRDYNLAIWSCTGDMSKSTVLWKTTDSGELDMCHHALWKGTVLCDSVMIKNEIFSEG